MGVFLAVYYQFFESLEYCLTNLKPVLYIHAIFITKQVKGALTTIDLHAVKALLAIATSVY